ncbi:hypothetical protein [Azospirillum sp. SYSU D00513]|uniref:hypothetical protein n=1 Tax=Azospirillum sp. SYSU D00513 TaxID=2812561 RepID=UPI001A96BC7A|nr:hypothetical protein [Azospirillum sp. SYSU D00513]
MDLLLTDDQKHWLLSAHPDTWELKRHSDDDVVMGCIRHGLVTNIDLVATRWRLTAKGGEVVRELRETA